MPEAARNNFIAPIWGNSELHPEAWLNAAYHESGHAVARHHFGWPLKRIELHENGGAVVGSVSVPGAYHNLLDLACTYLAGPLAEERHSGVDWSELALDIAAEDVQMAEKALSRMRNPPTLHQVADRARGVLQREWPTVQRVAYALAERKTLSYADFLKIVR